MAAACAVLVPLVEELGRSAGPGHSLAETSVTVLQRLLGWTFTLVGGGTLLRCGGVLQLLASCVQVGLREWLLVVKRGLVGAYRLNTRRLAVVKTALSQVFVSASGPLSPRQFACAGDCCWFERPTTEV